MSDGTDPTYAAHNRVGAVLGAALFVGILLTPAPAGLDPTAWRTAGVTLLMATWWITEAMPIPATALLPLVLFPLLGISGIRETAAPYAHPLIFLFAGGFLIALAMQRWNLHRRIALSLILLTGDHPHGLVFGFMLATAFLSMWVSNTATTLMMLPIALSVVQLLQANSRNDGDGPEGSETAFATSLMLAIAYAASIGGVGTLVGTPPNAFMASFVSDSYGLDIGFGRWMLVGLPLVAIMLPIAWLLLVRVLFSFRLPHGHDFTGVIRGELDKMGPMQRGERIVLCVFATTAILWIGRSLFADAAKTIGLNDSTIAMIGALSLFLLPVDFRRGVFALNWAWANRLPWGVLILFGGGLSLAGAIKNTGLAAWIGSATTALGGLPIVLVILAVVALIIFLTELTSNTATAATFVPIVASIAIGLGENPLLMVIPAALAASYAFMMPVATPPNAIVFGSGHIQIGQMIRAGIWLNILGVTLITAISYSIVLVVFGIEPGLVPDWAAGQG